MPAVNGTVRRFNNGGVLTIDGNTVSNIVSGSIKFQEMSRARIEYSDRGVIQQPLEGDDQAMDIEFTVNCGVYTGAGSLYASLVGSGSNGLVDTVSGIIVDIPDYRGASTGTRFTWATSGANYIWVAERPTYQAGGSPDGLDTLSCKLRANHNPTIATYP